MVANGEDISETEAGNMIWQSLFTLTKRQIVTNLLVEVRDCINTI